MRPEVIIDCDKGLSNLYPIPYLTILFRVVYKTVHLQHPLLYAVSERCWFPATGELLFSIYCLCNVQVLHRRDEVF